MKRLFYFGAGLNVPIAALAAWNGRTLDFCVAIACGAVLNWSARRYP